MEMVLLLSCCLWPEASQRWCRCFLFFPRYVACAGRQKQVIDNALHVPWFEKNWVVCTWNGELQREMKKDEDTRWAVCHKKVKKDEDMGCVECHREVEKKMKTWGELNAIEKWKKMKTRGELYAIVKDRTACWLLVRQYSGFPNKQKCPFKHTESGKKG